MIGKREADKRKNFLNKITTWFVPGPTVTWIRLKKNCIHNNNSISVLIALFIFKSVNRKSIIALTFKLYLHP